MKNTWLSLALGTLLAFAVGLAASACPYHQTSAANESSPPPQTAAASGQATLPSDN